MPETRAKMTPESTSTPQNRLEILSVSDEPGVVMGENGPPGCQLGRVVDASATAGQAAEARVARAPARRQEVHDGRRILWGPPFLRLRWDPLGVLPTFTVLPVGRSIVSHGHRISGLLRRR